MTNYKRVKKLLLDQYKAVQEQINALAEQGKSETEEDEELRASRSEIEIALEALLRHEARRDLERRENHIAWRGPFWVAQEDIKNDT